ncbi:MAG: hypothetical protein GXO58_05560 [Thermodesulfobacteria bacterium]|nr:hypothetical protein [Thermodesulfobacteriota bacterium]
MRLDDQRESRNVEDRRYQSGMRGGSFQTIFMLWPLIRILLRTKFGWAIIAIGVGAYLMGFNPLAILQPGQSMESRAPSKADDTQAVFIKKVLASTEDVWSQLLPKYGYKYQVPVLVLFRGATQSGCGFASAQVGPFYCPVDHKIYLDLSFYDELANRFGAPGDFAQAYVLAHEVGHHVQNIMGILQKVHSLQERAMRSGDKRAANRLQIPVELQADCFAGVWGHYARKYLEPGDIEEALNAASRIGDDTLQKETQGYVVPDSFTHGTSKQRMKWFMRGFDSGDIKQCNTFAEMQSL